jgi:non-heme chloroperoxidase
MCIAILKSTKPLQMETIQTKQTNLFIETEPGVRLYVTDYGEGKPVILIHGWPLSSDMWEYQTEALINAGLRVIAYDRRGFGQSSKPWNGYDYSTLAADLKSIVDKLELSDVTLIGFSMGGGEIVRYFNTYGSHNISKAALIASVTPYMLKTEDNPDGTPQEVFDGMAQKMTDDRMDFLEGFSKDFYGVGALSKPVSTAFLQHDLMVASCASPHATLECAKAFSSTDFREEMVSITVPTLVIHGDSDKTVPIKAAGEKASKLIPDCRYIVYDGAPHGLFYTEKDKLNKDLIDFIRS